MNKSIEFINKRITDGFSTLSFKDDVTMLEQPFDVMFDTYTNTSLDDNKFEVVLKFKNESGKDREIGIEIVYDPDAEFEYFTNESCICDGTLMFYTDLITKILNKLVHLGTYNATKFPSDFNEVNYKVRYTVGNFVIADEYGKEFATEEKPWLLSRFTAMLPIANDFIRL